MDIAKQSPTQGHLREVSVYEKGWVLSLEEEEGWDEDRFYRTTSPEGLRQFWGCFKLFPDSEDKFWVLTHTKEVSHES